MLLHWEICRVGGQEKIFQKSIHLRVFKGLYFVFCFSVFIEKCVHFFIFGL